MYCPSWNIEAQLQLPGTILAVFGFRSLTQDRMLEETQTRDALQSAVDAVSYEISRERRAGRSGACP